MSRTLLTVLVASVALFPLVGCSDDSTTAPPVDPSFTAKSTNTLAAEVRALTAGRGIGPLAEPRRQCGRSSSALGRALAFDKILSGNKDISCMPPPAGDGHG